MGCVKYTARMGRQGTETTTRDMRSILPGLLGEIGRLHQDRPDLIVAEWPRIIGERLSAMTRAVSFEQGILRVLVGNSALYSLLALHERERLLKTLRERFPSVAIKNIVFRVGRV